MGGWDGRLEPMAGRVIVQFDEGDEQTAGGIYIPDTFKHDKDEAVVLAVGPGKFDGNGNYMEPPVAVGDKILSNSVWGKTYKFFDESRTIQKVVIIGYNDIIAKVRG